MFIPFNTCIYIYYLILFIIITAGGTGCTRCLSITGNLLPKSVQQNTQTHQTQEHCPTMTKKQIKMGETTNTKQ